MKNYIEPPFWLIQKPIEVSEAIETVQRNNTPLRLPYEQEPDVTDWQNPQKYIPEAERAFPVLKTRPRGICLCTDIFYSNLEAGSNYICTLDT